MPTVRQKNAVTKTLENIGNSNPKTKGEILLESGYPPSIAKNPQIVEESKGFKELMEKYLPDSLLAEKHNELLTVPRKIRTIRKGEVKEEIEEIDSTSISKGLDMAYKIKGRYAPDRTVNVNVDINTELSEEDKKLLEIIREHDRNTRTEIVEDKGDIPDGVDTQPQD